MVTDTLRHGRRHWVAVTQIEPPGALAKVDATIRADGVVRLATEHVAALQLAIPRRLAAFPLAVEIDGATLRIDRQAVPGVSLHRREGAWLDGPPPAAALSKRPGLEGPIRDAFLDRLVFAYGSLDPGATRANREVAEHFAERYGGSAEYPILADTEVNPRLAKEAHLFLVGSKHTNSVVRAIADRLPIGVDGGAVRVGTTRHDAADVGAIFIHPNPASPERYVIVVQAPSPTGIWGALRLPKLLPDFVVYDSSLGPATAQQVLGNASVRSAGFFSNDWALPKDRLIDSGSASP